MSELRRNPIDHRWVVIAADRRDRPRDTAERDSDSRPGAAACPFCPGHESRTPAELHADRPAGGTPNAAGWNLRVVPNKFPALTWEDEVDAGSDGLHERLRGVGAHEVVIESPDHDADWSELPAESASRTLFAFRARMRALGSDPRIRYVLPFKNQGASAGASLAHGHAQVIATPIVPMPVQEELAGAEAHWRARGSCVFCDLVQHERRRRERVVLDEGGFVAVVPYAPRGDFETWILPTAHQASFEEASDDSVRALSRALQQAIARVRRALDRPDYNYLLHSSPCREPALPHYHWHVELVPRSRHAPAFEWRTGIHIDTTPPEEAARILREVTL